jgi:hypothetical protein
MSNEKFNSTHDKYAPVWASALFILCCLGLSTTWFDLGDFWKGYVLDMVGPAWNYILVRGLFTKKAHNNWTKFFNPHRTLVLFITICFGIETLQYFNIYNSTFDFWDLLAYISILIPFYLLDLFLIKKNER